MKRGQRRLATTAVGLLPPGPLKNRTLNRLGHDVHRRARIDPSLLLGVDHLTLGDRSRLAGLNVVRHVRDLQLAAGAGVGPRNWISAAPRLAGTSADAGTLRLGERATVSTRHRLDCSGGIRLGADAALAGWDTLVMTHDVSADLSTLTAEPVIIGDRTFVHAANRIAAGTAVPADVRTAIGTVLTPGWYEAGTRYAGNPAVPLGATARRLGRERTTGVVHVLPTVDDAFGGPGPVLAAWLAADGSADRATVFATVTRPGAVASRIAELAAVDYAAPGRFLGRFYGRAAQLRRVRQAVAGADLVVSHSFFHLPGLVAAVEARRLGVPWAIAPHGSLDPWDVDHHHAAVKHRLAPVWRWLLQDVGTWCVTAREADQLQTFGATTTAAVIPCPTAPATRVDVESALRTLGPLGRRLRGPVGRGGRVVSFVGRFDLKKGVDRLVAAFDAAAGDDDVLVLAGSGDAYWSDRVRQAVRRSTRADQIEVPGWLGPDAKTALWSLPGVFALTSDNENFGVAVAEAMAHGTPVLVTDKVALAPMIAAAGAGCVTTLDHEDIVCSLQRLLRDAPLTDAAGRRAAELVRDQLSAPAVAPLYRDAITRSLARNGSSRTSPLERIA